MNRIKVLIFMDDPLVREGIKLLVEAKPDICIVGDANDGSEALEFVKNNDVDVILVDIDMPKLNGVEATKIITQTNKQITVIGIGLSTPNSKGIVDKLLNAGAKGFILKNTNVNTLISSIRNSAMGLQLIDENTNHSSASTISYLNRTHGSEPVSDLGLTSRELEVLALIAEGLSNKEISAKLFISLKTVDGHRTSLMKKLNVHNVVGLVKYAIASGITTLLNYKGVNS